MLPNTTILQDRGTSTGFRRHIIVCQSSDTNASFANGGPPKRRRRSNEDRADCTPGTSKRETSKKTRKSVPPRRRKSVSIDNLTNSHGNAQATGGDTTVVENVPRVDARAPTSNPPRGDENPPPPPPQTDIRATNEQVWRKIWSDVFWSFAFWAIFFLFALYGIPWIYSWIRSIS